jgi:thiol-disulfide isomerase/thioredoxin
MEINWFYIIIILIVLYLLYNNIYENFNNSTDKITLYHAKWCGYCKKLMPQWYELKKTSNYNMVEVEDIEMSSEDKQNVSGFPTAIRASDNKQFVGIDNIIELIKSGASGNSNNSTANSEPLEQKTKDTITFYYSNNCTHCKTIMPIWLDFKIKCKDTNYPLNVFEYEEQEIPDKIEQTLQGYPTAIRSSDNKYFVGHNQIQKLLDDYVIN